MFRALNLHVFVLSLEIGLLLLNDCLLLFFDELVLSEFEVCLRLLVDGHDLPLRLVLEELFHCADDDLGAGGRLLGDVNFLCI